jgi:hypothetical protein
VRSNAILKDSFDSVHDVMSAADLLRRNELAQEAYSCDQVIGSSRASIERTAEPEPRVTVRVSGVARRSSRRAPPLHLS